MRNFIFAVVIVLLFCTHMVAAQDNSRFGISPDNANHIRLIQTLNFPHTSAVAWSPDGALIAVGSDDMLRVIDANTHGVRWERAANLVSGITWSYDSAMLAVTHNFGKVAVFDTENGTPVVVVTTQSPASAAFSPTENLLAYNDGAQLYVASMEFGNSERVWQMPATVAQVQWTPDGSQLAVVSQQSVLIWDINDGRELYRLSLTEAPVLQVNWRPQNAAGIAVIGRNEALIRVYPADIPALPINLQGHDGAVLDMDWSPDGHMMVSVGMDDRMLIWNVESNDVLSTSSIDTPRWVNWSPDGTQIFVAADNDVQFWGVDSSLGTRESD